MKCWILFVLPNVRNFLCEETLEEHRLYQKLRKPRIAVQSVDNACPYITLRDPGERSNDRICGNISTRVLFISERTDGT